MYFGNECVVCYSHFRLNEVDSRGKDDAPAVCKHPRWTYGLGYVLRVCEDEEPEAVLWLVFAAEAEPRFGLSEGKPQVDEGGVRSAAHEAERHGELGWLPEEALPKRHLEPAEEPVPAASQGDEEQGRTTD